MDIVIIVNFMFSHCFRGEAFDRSLIHMVEGIVIDWSRQIHDVLKKNSAQPLLEGKNPGPLVEIEFWDARRADLESIADQLCVDKVTKMGYLLEKTLSSYYPAFQSMIDTVFGSLEEAQDIRYKIIIIHTLVGQNLAGPNATTINVVDC